jgi:hypothetical protein
MNVGFATSDGTSTVDVQRLSQYTLSIDPVPGATSYFWSIGANATLDGGQGNNFVNVTITGSPGSSTSFAVQPVNDCGKGGGLVVQANIIGDGGGCDLCSMTVQTSPSPAKNVLYLTFASEPNAKLEKADKAQIIRSNLYNLFTGQLVRSWDLQPGQKQYLLNVAGLHKGQYALQVTLGSQRSVKQIIIE